MIFDPENKVVRLCAKGMEREGGGDPNGAAHLFRMAWKEAVTAVEKVTAAHYVARVQGGAEEKLKWDKISLGYAFQLDEAEAKAMLPSLFLNVAKDYEDLNDAALAGEYYQEALRHAPFLADDGYGRMIRAGIAAGLARIKTIS